MEWFSKTKTCCLIYFAVSSLKIPFVGFMPIIHVISGVYLKTPAIFSLVQWEIKITLIKDVLIVLYDCAFSFTW